MLSGQFAWEGAVALANAEDDGCVGQSSVSDPSREVRECGDSVSVGLAQDAVWGAAVERTLARCSWTE